MNKNQIKSLYGWGRTAAGRSSVVDAATTEDLRAAVLSGGERGLIARGLGRSYGDPAQNSGGLVVDMTRLKRIISIDEAAPSVTVEAGISLDDLMRALLPLGLWIPVLPGTRQVTIGGAISCDVHGKNHHSQGSFGSHILAMDLLLADGTICTVTPEGDTAELFWATVGGMGLTGIITQATIGLQRVESAYFAVDTDRCADLDELMAAMSEGDDDYTYSVAWFDAVTDGKHRGRAVLTRGEKATLDQLPAKLRKDPLAFAAPSFGTFPDVFPNRVLNRLTGKMFSEFWFRKAPKHAVGQIQNITAFFHPLDIVSDWNRVYGPAGFLQYQFVVPFEEHEAFRRCVETIVTSGHTSALNVLKRFGPGNPAPLSFPREGWTLTVDFPITDGLAKLCARLDELVLGAGGRHYLAKDSRIAAADFATGYPRLDEFRAICNKVDPDHRFVSDQARRLKIR